MLPGDRPPELAGDVEDRVEGEPGPRGRLEVPPRGDERRVEVPVSRVSQGRDHHVETLADLGDRRKERTDAPQRDRDVVDQDVTQRFERRQGHPAGREERLGLLRRLRAVRLRGACLEARRFEGAGLNLTGLSGKVALDEDEGGRLGVEPHRS